MERKAVLLEREEKAKENERNKITNKKKRLEKEEKAKAQRKGAGVVEEGYVSPRQVRLAAYFVKIGAQDGDGDCKDQLKSVLEGCDLPRLCLEESVVGEDAQDGDQDCEKAVKSPLEDYDLPSPRPCVKESMVEGGTQNVTLETPSRQQPQEFNLSDNDWAAFLPTNTQIERELSESDSTAPASAVKEDIKCLGLSHLEHLDSQTPIASPCDLKSNIRLQRLEDLSELPPFSTQDLEFSPDEILELMSPAKFPEPVPSRRGISSAEQLNPLYSASRRVNPLLNPGHYDNGKNGAAMQKLTKKLAATPYQRTPSRNPQHTMSSKPTIASKLPKVEDQIPQPPAYPTPAKSSTKQSYVLADREVVPGHAKYVLNRVSKTAPTKKFPKPIFANPSSNMMRPPPRKPLGASKGNTTRVGWNKLALTSSKDESKKPTLQTGENRRPSSFETAAAAFDFGDSFLSTQELLDYVV